MKLFIFCVLLSLNLFALTGIKVEEKPVKYYQKIKKVCIEGYTYFLYDDFRAFAMAPKLTVSGHPVPCKSQEVICIKQTMLNGCVSWGFKP